MKSRTMRSEHLVPLCSRSMRSKLLDLAACVAAFTLVCPAARTQEALAQGEVARELRAALDELLADEAMRGTRFGFCLRDPAQQKPLLEHRADEGYITASNMKLISSAVALDVFGPEHVFETRLVGRGEIVDGVLRGDLLLVGSGDPTLGARRFEPAGATAPFVRMAAALKKRGISKITGRVLGDDSVLPDEIMGLGWDWAYHADWYAAQIGGLCFNENCIDVVFDGAAVGEAPRIRLDPETEYVRVDNRVRCVAEKARGVHWTRGLGNNRITLRGTLLVTTEGKRDWGSVHNPTAYAATVLRETLIREGIEVLGNAGDLDEVEPDGPARGDDGARTVLAKHTSPPMAKILHGLNKRSQNLYAEQLPRLAAKLRGGDGSMASVRRLTRSFLTAQGCDLGRFVMADGSGLSRLNLVEPRQLAALLVGMRKHEHFSIWYESLPIAGVDGTLRRRFRGENPARGKVRAKTGYVGRVVGLSGYVPRQGSAPWVFSILVNDFVVSSSRIKALVDRFIGRICVLSAS